MNPQQFPAQPPPQRFPQPPPVPAPLDRTELSRDRGYKGSLWASVSMVLFLCAALATWGQYRSPGGSATPALVLGPVSFILQLSGIATAVVVFIYVLMTLFALRDRALAWEPPLARGNKSIANAHLYPVLNLTGPITVLMETGVPRAGRSPGAFAWWAACLTLPFAVYLGFSSDTAVEVVRANVVAAICVGMVAVAGRGLDFALTPGERRRYFALPGHDSYGSLPFWERGIAPEPTRRTRTGDSPPLAVEDVVEDPVEKLFIKEQDR